MKISMAVVLVSIVFLISMGTTFAQVGQQSGTNVDPRAVTNNDRNPNSGPYIYSNQPSYQPQQVPTTREGRVNSNPTVDKAAKDWNAVTGKSGSNATKKAE